MDQILLQLFSPENSSQLKLVTLPLKQTLSSAAHKRSLSPRDLASMPQSQQETTVSAPGSYLTELSAPPHRPALEAQQLCHPDRGKLSPKKGELSLERWSRPQAPAAALEREKPRQTQGSFSGGSRRGRTGRHRKPRSRWNPGVRPRLPHSRPV